MPPTFCPIEGIDLAKHDLACKLGLRCCSLRPLKRHVLSRTPTIAKGSDGYFVLFKRRFVLRSNPFWGNGFGSEWLPQQDLHTHPVHATIAVLLKPGCAHKDRNKKPPGNDAFGSAFSCINFGRIKKSLAHPAMLEVPSSLFVAVNPDAVDEVQVGTINE